MIGPVQEKEISTSVSAIKKMPAKLCMPAYLSVRVPHEAGRLISKAPRNDMPNNKKITKNIRLASQLVARLFSAAGPNISVIKKPSSVKMMMIDKE